jgi:hypothetical protein
MTKKFLTFGILVVVLGVVFAPSVVFAQATETGITDTLLSAAGELFQITGNVTFGPLIAAVGYITTTLSSLVLIICGMIFDTVVQYTIIDVSKNIGSSSSMGASISEAWGVLRVIANMCIIFVLLYAALKNMFDTNFGNFQTTIKNIIIIALLINFSLFFTKVVIDASNIVSVGFYQAIASNNEEVGSTILGGTANFKGVSGGYMRMLGMQTWYSANILAGGIDAQKIFITAFMSSSFMLVSAMIFLITGVMFAARFIILIFIMILSPLALIAYAIPGMRGRFNTWLSALISQSFFAPLYFALTWVAFKLGNALITPTTSWVSLITEPFKDQTGSMTLLLNYVLVIGFSIAALVFAKQMASSTFGFKQISGGIGAVALGGAALAGRNTVGRGGKFLSENANLQKAAKEKTGFAGAGARLALYASKKAAGGTFDARNATIPTSTLGAAIEGTLGRTPLGKKLGLNDVNIPSVAVSSIVKDMDLLGKGGTKGYKETKAESDKRVQDREAAASSELRQAQAKKAVIVGASAPLGSPAIDEMEKELSKLSDKETEALVASNRELLKSQNFANAISVKQLEALNKSDQFSEAEKGDVKNMRFDDINKAVAAGNSASVKGKIKGLSDSELEMLNSNYMGDTDFVAQMRPAQVDAVIKSSKFTSSQKNKIRDARKQPLIDAINAHDEITARAVIKRLSAKEITSLDLDTVLRRPTILKIYTPEMLKRMAAEMDISDISILRADLETRGNSKTIDWLNKDPGNFS